MQFGYCNFIESGKISTAFTLLNDFNEGVSCTNLNTFPPFTVQLRLIMEIILTVVGQQKLVVL